MPQPALHSFSVERRESVARVASRKLLKEVTSMSEIDCSVPIEIHKPLRDFGAL